MGGAHTHPWTVSPSEGLSNTLAIPSTALCSDGRVPVTGFLPQKERTFPGRREGLAFGT